LADFRVGTDHQINQIAGLVSFRLTLYIFFQVRIAAEGEAEVAAFSACVFFFFPFLIWQNDDDVGRMLLSFLPLAL